MPISKPPKSDAAGQRIAKLLARAGVASRREIERMIADGRIALNGVALDTPATLLSSLHGVTVDGRPVAEPSPARLFRFHKSSGLLTTEHDPAGRPTIYDRMPEGLPRVMPVGRLDFNTEGLLLLTTDGELKRQLELPATGVERTYRARAYGQVSQEQLEDLMLGIEIEGMRYGPINANIERRTGANLWIEMTLTEGKNREVRRVLEHLGLEVSRLIRTRYGPFYLGDLPAGDVDEIRQHDLVTFRTVLAKPGGGKAASNLQFAVRQRVEAPLPKPVVEPEGRRRIAKPVAAPKTPSFTARATPKPVTGDHAGRSAPGAAAGGNRRSRPSLDKGAERPARAARAKAFRDAREPSPARTDARPTRPGTLGLRDRRETGETRPDRAAPGGRAGRTRTPRPGEATDRAGAGPRTPRPNAGGDRPERPRTPRPGGPGGSRPGRPDGGGRPRRPDGGGRPPRGRS